MPTISPVVRPSIGGPSDSVAPRLSLTASTGNKFSSSVPTEETGQPDNKQEGSSSQAVTLSPQLTVLARKQQKLQAEIQALRSKEAAFAAKEADYVPKSVLKTKMQENAEAALKDLGFSYEEITDLLLQQQNAADPVNALKAEIKQIKATQEQNTNKQYDATLKQYRAETDSLISANPQTYLFISGLKRQDAVVEHIVQTWKEDESKVLTVEQAAKEVEEFLREEGKFQASLHKKLEPAIEESVALKDKKLPPPKSAVRTLTNQVEVAPKRTFNQFQHMSMQERIQTAIARAQK